MNDRDKALKEYLRTIHEEDRELAGKGFKEGWNASLECGDIIQQREEKLHSKRSIILINEAKAKVMSYEDMINHLRTLPRTPETDRIIINLNQQIRDINGDGNYTQMHMTKEMCEEFQVVRKKKRQGINLKQKK
jgi:hypothetical protein